MSKNAAITAVNLVKFNLPRSSISFIQLFILSCFIYSCSFFPPKYTSGLEGQALPDFDLTRQDSATPFRTSFIPAKTPFAVFLYRPNCAYCRSQLQDILKNIEYFKDTRLYLVTSYPYDAVKYFSNHYHLGRYPGMVLLRDSANQFFTYFNAPGVPYLAFYNRQRRLKRVVIGKNDFAIIKNIISDLYK
jgi:hypothetical protein